MYGKKQLIASMFLCAGFAVLPLAGQDSKGPVALWKFEKHGSSVPDSSGNGNEGEIQNNVKSAHGRTGNALSLSLENKKNGCVIIPGMASKYGFFTRGITVEAWIKLNSSFKREDTYEIVSNTESERGKGFRLLISWGRLCLRSGEGVNGGKTWEASSNPSAYQFKSEVWYHVAGVYDGSIFKVYIDGELAGQSGNFPLTPGRKDLYIGAYCGGYAYGFDGVIDEVRIYDYPRSDLQILQDAKIE